MNLFSRLGVYSYRNMHSIHHRHKYYRCVIHTTVNNTTKVGKMRRYFSKTMALTIVRRSTRCSVCTVATRPTSYLRSRINSHGLLHLRTLEIVQNNFIKANTIILTTLGGELCRQVRSKSVIFKF